MDFTAVLGQLLAVTRKFAAGEDAAPSLLPHVASLQVKLPLGVAFRALRTFFHSLKMTRYVSYRLGRTTYSNIRCNINCTFFLLAKGPSPGEDLVFLKVWSCFRFKGSSSFTFGSSCTGAPLSSR